MAEINPLKQNTAFRAVGAGSTRYPGYLNTRLELYEPLAGEQDWAQIAGANFHLLQTAALVDVNNDFRAPFLNRVLGALEVEWPAWNTAGQPQFVGGDRRKAAVPLQFALNLEIMSIMGGF